MRRPQFALLALLLAPAAFADGSNGSNGSNGSDFSNSTHARGAFELTPTFSYNFGGTITGEDSELSSFDLQANDGEAFGVTLDIPLSPWAQIELLASRQQTELEYDAGLFGGSTGFADFNVSYYQVGGLFQWGNGQIRPFVVLGLGVTTLDPNVAGARAENRLSGSIGGGDKIFFTDNIGLRLEGRGFWTVLDGNNGDYHWQDDCYSCDYGYTNSFDQGQASAGLIIAW